MKKISKAKYFQVVGLLTLAKTVNKELENIEKSLADVLDEKKDDYGSYGHISDEIVGDCDPQRLLEKLDIKVCRS